MADRLCGLNAISRMDAAGAMCGRRTHPSPTFYCTCLRYRLGKERLTISHPGLAGRVKLPNSTKPCMIAYATVPGERVQAYLLLSRGNEGQNPGVLAIHQDGAERPYRFGGSEPAGVAGDPELPYGRELCQRATSSSVSSRTPRPTSSAPI